MYHELPSSPKRLKRCFAHELECSIVLRTSVTSREWCSPQAAFAKRSRAKALTRLGPEGAPSECPSLPNLVRCDCWFFTKVIQGSLDFCLQHLLVDACLTKVTHGSLLFRFCTNHWWFPQKQALLEIPNREAEDVIAKPKVQTRNQNHDFEPQDHLNQPKKCDTGPGDPGDSC